MSNQESGDAVNPPGDPNPNKREPNILLNYISNMKGGFLYFEQGYEPGDMWMTWTIVILFTTAFLGLMIYGGIKSNKEDK
jgi:hypothetical protein